MNKFSIKDVESLTGIKAHTIRMWEQRYNLLDAKRSSTNIRYYDEKDLQYLLNVSVLNQNGHKISKIAQFTDEQIKHSVFEISKKSIENSSQIQLLIAAMLNYDEQDFEKIFSHHIAHDGLEHTMIELIFPFFKMIGVLWQTGTIKPAQEHFITNLIKQKIAVAIDAFGYKKAHDQTPKYILYLPENEYHELGLLFAHYIIKSRNKQSIFLGTNVPYDDLDSVVRTYKAENLFTVLTSGYATENLQAYINQLAHDFPQCNIHITGSLIANAELEQPKNVRIIRGFYDFLALINP